MKRNKKMAKLLLFLLILCISVGYAILQTNLNIQGTANMNNPTWDIHWANISVSTGSVNGSNVTTPATIDGAKTTIDYNIELSKPGDFYEFTLDAVNEGTIDAMIDTVSSELNGTEITTLPAYLDYAVTYSDDVPIEASQELKAGTSEKYKVRVEFKKDINSSQLPTDIINLNMTFSVVYKQATDSAKPRINPISFSTDDWGTIVATIKNNKPNNYNVGNEKTVDMGSFGIHTLRIANKSTSAECSTTGFSQTACGFVLEFADVVSIHRMNPAISTITENGNGNKGGWEYSEIRVYVNTDIYNALPRALKNGMIDTTVISGKGYGDSSNFTTTDKLYLLSTHEVWEDVDGDVNNGIDRYDSAYANTRQLDYYANLNVTTSNSSAAIKRLNGSTCVWWLRSPCLSTSLPFFYRVNTGGTWNAWGGDTAQGVSPAFRIG